MDELKEKIARAIDPRSFVIENSKRFEVREAQDAARRVVQAALTAIEEAGYAIVRVDNAVEMPPIGDSRSRGGMPPMPAIVEEHINFRTASEIETDRLARKVELHLIGGGINLDHYATLSDSATAFDPEKQFEADREEETK
jgi:hypothetical protein